MKQIRAKLLAPKRDDELNYVNEPTTNGKPMRAIMAPPAFGELAHEESLPSRSENCSTLTLNSDYGGSASTYSDVMPNDFAIDIIQIEKMVQDSDTIVLDKK
jgi:hypothetical protein